MTGAGAALIAEVIAHPNDDATRLVYADWLEERGEDDARVEAIRLGVRRRRLDDLDPESWVLDTRLRLLNDRHRKRWQARLPKLKSAGGWGGHWAGVEAGFVNSVRQISPEALREQ